MSNAWETTCDDVRIVLDAYGVKVGGRKVGSVHEGLDHEGIEDAVLSYADMDDQTNSMLSHIEDYLISEGIVPKGGKKKFQSP